MNVELKRADFTRECNENIRIETVPFETGFEWMNGKQYKVPKDLNGHLYAFHTLTIEETTNGAIWTETEKLASARTLIGKPVGLNHLYTFNTQNLVIDAEFNTALNRIEGFAYIEDPMLNGLYEANKIGAVSVEYRPRHETCTGKHCIVEGNYFIGLDFTSAGKRLGDPTSELIRIETSMDETQSQKLMEQLGAHITKLTELLKEPEKNEAMDALSSKLDTVVETITGLTKRIETLEIVPDPKDDPEVRKETAISTDGGDVTGLPQDKVLDPHLVEKIRSSAVKKATGFML